MEKLSIEIKDIFELTVLRQVLVSAVDKEPQASHARPVLEDLLVRVIKIETGSLKLIKNSAK